MVQGVLGLEVNGDRQVAPGLAVVGPRSEESVASGGVDFGRPEAEGDAPAEVRDGPLRLTEAAVGQAAVVNSYGVFGVPIDDPVKVLNRDRPAQLDVSFLETLDGLGRPRGGETDREASLEGPGGLLKLAQVPVGRSLQIWGPRR